MGTFNDGDSGSSIRTKINTAIQKTEGTSAISTIDVDGGAIDGVTLGTNSAVTEAQVDNININGNAITSTDTNGNIALTPNGSGEVDISKVDIDAGAIDGVTIGTNSAVTDLRVDNLKVDGNTISSTDTNGDVIIDPNGTGNVKLGNFEFDADQTVGSGQDNYVLTYDHSSTSISLEAAAGGGGDPDLYADNYDSTSTQPSAGGTNGVAIGVSASAAGTHSIAIGFSTATSGTGSISLGYNAGTNSGQAAALGDNALANQSRSLALGYSSQASNYGSAAIGYDAKCAINYGLAFGLNGSGFSTDMGFELMQLCCDTTDATPTVMTTDNSGSNDNNTIKVDGQSIVAFEAMIAARQKDDDGTDCAVFKVTGAAREEGGNSTVTLLNSTTTVIHNPENMAIAVSANTSNGTVDFTFTGLAAHDIRTVATVQVTRLKHN